MTFKRYSNGRLLLIALLALTLTAYAGWFFRLTLPAALPQLLSDPFLQLPTANTVQVVWFTEFAGTSHTVEFGQNLEKLAIAQTTKLSRVREDQQSRVGLQTADGQVYAAPAGRDIWRHEAQIPNLTSAYLPYRVVSTREDGQRIFSDRFQLRARPEPGMPLKILLTSDHQLMPMTPANLEKVAETAPIDAVFLAGDLVNIPDRASEWFDDNRGGAFFPSLQGRASALLTRGDQATQYRGGAIIQSAPLFPATGNHEVMGRFSIERPLNEQYNDPVPRSIATDRYATLAGQINPLQDVALQQRWLKDYSFNSDTYEEIFSLPSDSPGGETYYAVSFGDVRLISLYAANIWRVPSLEPSARGKYRERDADLANEPAWGFGQHIFEPIAPGSAQYDWLQAELNRPEFRQAKYKIVMLHYPPHSLGDNIVPAYTDPQQILDRLPDGSLNAVRYEYPKEADYLIRDVMPLLEAAGVQLIFYGHSHLWNRFISPGGMHFLESSNVGNTYGAYVTQRRAVPIGFEQVYVATGDPNGLQPVLPTQAAGAEAAQPYLASNDISAFSILDTGSGVVSSYQFDTRLANPTVTKFDEFQLN